MHEVYEALDDAEKTWRNTIKVEYPLFINTPVEKAKEDEKNKRHWMFYTDSKTTHMDVFKPKVIQEIFEKVIKPMYEKAYPKQSQNINFNIIKKLTHDVFTYLYFHEQFHPTYCPDSKTDEKLFDKCLYEGIKKSESNLSKDKILRKVGNVRNAGWDQVIDTAFFYLSNYENDLETRINTVLKTSPYDLNEISYLPDGVISVFDIIEFEVVDKDKPFNSMFYPLTRAIYGLMFTKESEMRSVIFDYFKNKIEKQMRPDDFKSVVTNSIKGFISELSNTQLQFYRIDKQKFYEDVETIFDKYNDPSSDDALKRINEIIHSVSIDKKTRYKSIKGFIQPLSKYISLSQEEKRHGTHINGNGSGQGSSSGQSGEQGNNQGENGNGSNENSQTNTNQPGGNTEQALINLAEVLGIDEGNDLLISVANAIGGQQGGPGSKDKRLYNLAKDEYYKINVKEIDIKSPNYDAVKIDLGKKSVPKFVSSRNISIEDVIDLPLDKIDKFQEEYGITQLFRLSDYEYRFDDYEMIEIEDTDYSFENTDLNLPDNLIFHVDSSGSMGNPQYVGTGEKYDTLMHVAYGILKTLKKASAEMKKEINIMTVNFSKGTFLSKPIELNEMYDTPNNEAKIILTGFQSGGTEYNPKTFNEISKKLKPGKTVHVWATDGELNTGCQNETFEAIQKAIQIPEVSFLYFEIGTSSAFGKRIKELSDKYSNIKYYPNTKISDIQNNAMEILLEYS